MFQFQNTLSIADVFNFFLIIATIIAVYLAYRQIRENNKTQKASFSKDLYSIILSDKDFIEAFYMIEYGKFHYDDHFHESSYEKSIDRMLYDFNLVCYLYDQKILTEREMEPFKYFLFRVYQDANIQKYTKYLEILHLTLGMHLPYQIYLDYCRKEMRIIQSKQEERIHHLTVEQAYVFYEEHKSRLDELLALAKQQAYQEKDESSSFLSQLRALDMLIDQLQVFFSEHQPPQSENVLYTAITKSGFGSLPRVLIGLEALRARFLIEENKRLQKEVHSVPDSISIDHLFKDIN